MIDTIAIRKAARSDLRHILNLYCQEDMDNGKVLSLKEAERIFEKFPEYPNYSLYVAIAQGKVVGTFALLIMDNLAHMGRKSAVVEDVVVDKKHRSMGIGQQMMQYAMETCKKHKCYKLTLSSNLKRDKAHAFYENLGFKKHGYSFHIDLDA